MPDPRGAWHIAYAALPGRLQAARLRRRLTQQDLAARLGVSLSTIERLESGRGDPKARLLFAFAAAVGLTIRITEADPSEVTGEAPPGGSDAPA